MNAKAAEDAKPERLNAEAVKAATRAVERKRPRRQCSWCGSESRGNGRRRAAGKAGGIHRRFGSGHEGTVEIHAEFVSGPEPTVSVALRRTSPAVPAAPLRPLRPLRSIVLWPRLAMCRFRSTALPIETA